MFPNGGINTVRHLLYFDAMHFEQFDKCSLDWGLGILLCRRSGSNVYILESIDSMLNLRGVFGSAGNESISTAKTTSVPFKSAMKERIYRTVPRRV